MNRQYNEIIRRLQEIDPASFQLLINQYLWLDDPSIVTVSPNGSHAFKLKTTTGRPDVHFWLDDGRCMWAEHATTEKRRIVKKFKADIDACAEEMEKLGMGKSEIRELKLCYNVDLELDQERELKVYGKNKGFEISLLGRSTLANDLAQKYPGLAELFLSVDIGTGQLFFKKHFIQYKIRHSGGISTPLDNPFVGRKDEVAELKLKIEQHSIVCVTGPSGVGKTRLALHVLEELSSIDQRPVFVLEENGQDVYRDLQLWFSTLQSGYLLVEDANRQLNNLKQVLNYLKRKAGKDFRIVMTVRNYAREAVERELVGVDAVLQIVETVPNEVIREIINDAPFYIRNDKQKRDIVSLVQGNIRFALMAARLWKDRKVSEIPNSLLQLFDSYFSTYVKDIEELLDPTYLKTLGVLSLFHAVDFGETEKEKREKILSDFEVDPENFRECIIVLHRRELVVKRFKVAILSEQVFAGYFFYLAFIKHEVLSFTKAMDYHFSGNNTRLEESIKEIVRRFGKKIVLDAVELDLLAYESELEDEEDFERYFSVFWQFREEALLSRIAVKIEQLPITKEQEFLVAIDNQSVNHYIRSNELRLLENLFQSDNPLFQRAITQAFRFCEKMPESFPSLIKICKDAIVFKSDGELGDIERQQYLFRYLIKGVEAHRPLSIALFLSLAGFYLSHFSSVQEHHYALKAENKSDPVSGAETLRTMIWRKLHDLYHINPHAVRSTLTLLANGRYGQVTKQTLVIDVEWTCKIICDHFSPESIGDTALAQHLIYDLKEFDSQIVGRNDYCNSLRKNFSTPAFKTLIDLGWRFWQLNKGQDIGLDEIREKHSEMLSEHYLFSNLDEARKFIKILIEIVAAGLHESGGEIHRGLEAILLANLQKRHDIGKYLLREWLSLDLRLGNSVLNYLGKQKDRVNMFLNALDQQSEEGKLRRFWFFARFISPEAITANVKELFEKTVGSLPHNTVVDFQLLRKYATDNETLLTWIKVVQQQVNSGKRLLFSKDLDLVRFLLERDQALTKAIYLLHVGVDDIFDHQLHALGTILAQHPEFIVDYVQAELIDVNISKRQGGVRPIGRVWEIAGVVDYFPACADLILNRAKYSLFAESKLQLLLNGISEKGKVCIKPIILKYVVDNVDDQDRLRHLMNCIREKLFHFYFQAVFLYLDEDNTVELFHYLQWTPSGGVFADKTNVSRWRAANWQEVYDMIMQYSGNKDISGILLYIQNRIAIEEKAAIEEDKRMFAYG